MVKSAFVALVNNRGGYHPRPVIERRYNGEAIMQVRWPHLTD